jgi:hypothetical protein
MTERKRTSHFALMDSAFTADRKFVRLARKASIPIEYAAAVGVYWIVLADCRRSKSPEVDWDDYAEYAPQLDLLREVGLLSDTGFPPDPFEKWAPKYKSPADSRRTGTQGNAGGRNGTHGNAISNQLNSNHFTSEGGPGETAVGVWNGEGIHDGRHGRECAVCAPLLPELRSVS